MGRSLDEADIMITWREHNQTAEEPVTRISNDPKTSFGPIMTSHLCILSFAVISFTTDLYLLFSF